MSDDPPDDIAEYTLLGVLVVLVFSVVGAWFAIVGYAMLAIVTLSWPPQPTGAGTAAGLVGYGIVGNVVLAGIGYAAEHGRERVLAWFRYLRSGGDPA